jgi:hypothetical protein
LNKYLLAYFVEYMAAISDDYRYKILLHLGLPKTEKFGLWDKLDACEIESPALIARILQIVADLDAVRFTAVQVASKRAGLRKADVLEWDTDKICCAVGHGQDKFSKDLANLIGYDLATIPHIPNQINAF